MSTEQSPAATPAHDADTAKRHIDSLQQRLGGEWDYSPEQQRYFLNTTPTMRDIYAGYMQDAGVQHSIEPHLAEGKMKLSLSHDQKLAAINFAYTKGFGTTPDNNYFKLCQEAHKAAPRRPEAGAAR